MKNNFDTVILAAGLGVRMKSSTPKVFHKICDKPLLWWVVRSSVLAGTSSIVVVTRKDIHNKAKEEVLSWQSDFGRKVKFDFAIQKKQLGSGDALKSAGRYLDDNGRYLLTLSADTPLITPDTIKKFVSLALKNAGKSFGGAVLTADIQDPSGYGRIVRTSSPDGEFLKIVEDKDASYEEKLIKEINIGAYLFNKKYLKKALSKIKAENVKKEYYITDVFEIMRRESLSVSAIKTASASEALGINNRWELSQAEKILQLRINKKIMIDSGVTFIDPERAYIGPEVKIGADTVIYPGVMIKGRTTIGSNCVIGSGTYIKNTQIGNCVRIRSSYIYESKISDDVLIGPFAHIRPGTVILKGSRIGNFTEIKKSFVGENTKISHLAYIGDSELAGDINVGAGAITCNYDGVKKHKTFIGKGSFIGSNVNLVAPINIGKNVLVGAGSTITRDVPDNMLALERSEQTFRPNKKLLK